MTTVDWDFPVSHDLYERARRVIPGGSTRGSIFYSPHPLYAVEGEGCRVRFEDGHEALDFLNNFTSLVLGHQHPGVVAALRKQLDRAIVLGAPTRGEVELAEVLVERMPAVEQVVFASTGSEAIMAGLRLARALTGREEVAKFEGGYHGGYDQAKVSGMVGPDDWGDVLEPASVPDTAGLPSRVASEVHVLQFNSLPSVERVLDRDGDRIAVVVVEPVLGVGGLITPEPGFLEELRRLTRERGIVLLFDEVITQRLAVGGAQERYGVVPDLVVVSKVTGGGLPISALGGQRRLMAALDGSGPDGALVYHSGTYNANPLSVAASLATLEALDAALLARIDALGEAARAGLREVLAARGVPATVTGVGSLFNVHFTPTQPRSYRDVRGQDVATLREFHRRMLAAGVLLATRGLGCVSAPMGQPDIDELVRTTDQVLAGMGW
jgi:glutamate-1-semialdehyde 2,1-aminomutase